MSVCARGVHVRYLGCMGGVFTCNVACERHACVCVVYVRCACVSVMCVRGMHV